MPVLFDEFAQPSLSFSTIAIHVEPSQCMITDREVYRTPYTWQHCICDDVYISMSFSIEIFMSETALFAKGGHRFDANHPAHGANYTQCLGTWCEIQ